MIQASYEKIRGVYAAKGYQFYDSGNFNLNIGFIRESDTFTDRLTDTMFVCYREDLIRRIAIMPATTKAGLSPALFNPKVVAGKKGCAVMVPGQYLGAYQFVDSYFGWLKYPYFQQVKPVKMWRDYDGDLEIDKVQEQEMNAGLNIHRMSGIGIAAGILGNWSEGCLGAAAEDLEKKVFGITRKSVELYGNSFTLTLLESKDLS